MDAVETSRAERTLTGLISLPLRFFFSMKTALLLLTVFAFSCAVATFIENSYGRDAARELVYSTRWFEVLVVLITISALGNIYRYRLWRLKKLPLLFVHLSFLLILIGGGLTKYFGLEGVVHIREGEVVNKGVTYDHYFHVKLVKDGKIYTAEKMRIVSPITKPGFSEEFRLGGEVVKVDVIDYKPAVDVKVVPKKGGEEIVHIVLEGGYNVVLREGSVYDARMFKFVFGREEERDYVKVFFKGNKPYMVSDEPVEWFRMTGEKGGDIKPGQEFPLESRKVYRREGVVFMLLDAQKEGKLELKEDVFLRGRERQLSAMRIKVSYRGDQRLADLLFVKEGGFTYLPTKLRFGSDTVEIAYGQKVVELPFSIKLEDFIIERYPGSNSPSSYESRVVVIDSERGTTFPYRIYMNHTLDYRGFRFFQMSYDPDERGTVLSFNKDPGTAPMYAGFLLLCVSLVSALAVRMKNLFLVLLVSVPVLAWSFPTRSPSDPAKALQVVKRIDKEVAEGFCRLTVQGGDGRMETMHTFAIEVMNKVHGKQEFLGLTPCQTLLGMITLPLFWQTLPFVKVDHPQVKEKLGLLPHENYISFLEALDNRGRYKLLKETEVANRKDPPKRSKFDKEVLKVTERLNILYLIFTGELPRMFPIKEDPNKTWYGLSVAVTRFPKEKAERVSNMMRKFFTGVMIGVDRGDWSLFREALRELKEFQREEGGELVLPEKKVTLEILYNELNIFERLTLPFLAIGLSFFLLLIAESVLGRRRSVRVLKLLLASVYTILTVLILFGLGLRWYVAGHAPWSNAYESIVLMAASSALGGFLLLRKTFAPLAGSLLASSFLFIAHLNWLDPQITTLVPVLKSYWLIYHAGVTVASYGFLGVSAVLGLIGMILLSLPWRWVRNVNFKEITKASEASMLIGFVLLNIGNILGAVWANESWGRYWGWDPKETWTLITILVYAVVLHLKYTKLYTPFNFLLLSMFAYLSVLMTYFGVNFLLTGLHSYASGEFQLPGWVYVALSGLGLISLTASRNRKKLAEVWGR